MCLAVAAGPNEHFQIKAPHNARVKCRGLTKLY